MSVLMNQLAVNVINGLPLRMPETVVRIAATVPASTTPAAILLCLRASAVWPLASMPSNDSPTDSAPTRSDGGPKGGVQGKSVTVRVDLGGGCLLKQKTILTN